MRQLATPLTLALAALLGLALVLPGAARAQVACGDTIPAGAKVVLANDLDVF